MKPIIKLLKHKSLLAVVALVLLISLILVAGRKYGVPLNTQLLIIIAIIFLCIFFLLIKQLKANRGAVLLERSIQSQADEQKLSLRPEKRGEIEELRRELLAAIDSLKKTRLAKGRSGRAALYALPWYMFIGPPAAGKTTAIINSGLEFPYGSDIKGIGGTRNCDWFFSNSAIILDTAGRYVTEDEDRAEWVAFLDILKKYRRKRPINGVVVGMSITDILKENSEGLDWHAQNIRRRIDELIQRLGVCFPVYLVFTKCDLLQGFVELFESYNRKEREQVWGSTFSRSRQPDLHPGEIFEREFDLLVNSLRDVRMKQLAAAPKPENRGKIYTFPLQFEAVKENISYFIGQLLKPNPYQEGPYFRGFYFTSGTQEGVPIDRVIQAIARQFDLPPEVVSEAEIQKKSYFIKDLFTEIIIPDQNLVFQTSKTAAKKSLARVVTVTSSVVLLAAFVFGISQAFIRSRIQLNTVKNSTNLTKDVAWDNSQTLVANFKNLDRYREELARLEERRLHKPWIRSGMDRGSQVLEPARLLYLRKISPFIKMHFFQESAERLKANRYNLVDPEVKVYNCLKAYLLMGLEVGRLNSSDIAFLKQELIFLLNERYPRILPQDTTEEYKPLVQRQIDFFVDSLSLAKEEAFENDKTLIADIRKLISHEPTSRDVYDRMKRNAESQIQQSFSLSQILGPQDRDLISSDPEVPGLFTKMGWESAVEPMIKQSVEAREQVDWVLGQSMTQLASDLRDPEKLAQELHNLYFREYAAKWWQFLSSIQYRPFGDLAVASDALKRMSSRADSPLILIIEAVAKQTRFEAESSSGFADKLKEKARRKVAKTGLMSGKRAEQATGPEFLNQEFEKLHKLIAPGGEDKGDELSLILNEFANVRAAVETILNDPGPKAKDYALGILQRGEGELPSALNKIRRTFDESEFDPVARQAVFEKPLKNLWAVILWEAQGQLNGLWKNKVYNLFQQYLARSYPFNPQGEEDASLPEVSQFFNPQGGTLWKFVDEDLSPFVKIDGWVPLRWEDQGIRLSPGAMDALNRASAIKEGLFYQGVLKVRFKLQPEHYVTVSGRDPVIDQIDILIDGKRDSYRMGGVSWIDFTWPGQEGLSGASLVISSRKEDFSPLKYDGEWGWFKLLNKASIEGSTSREYIVFWLFGQKDRTQVQIKYRLKAESPLNPFRNAKDFFDFRCPEYLGELN